MSSATEHHGDHGHHAHEPRVLPHSLAAPPELAAWRMRALIVSAVFGILSLAAFVWTHEGRNHLLRAYLAGYMTCFNLTGGALVMLMLQYVTGGKWGLLLRRPLEAMTRTLPLVAVLFIPVAVLGKHLYQWMAYPTQETTQTAFAQGIIDKEQALTANFKRPMLNPQMMVVESVGIFAILLVFMYLLNKWSAQQRGGPGARHWRELRVLAHEVRKPERPGHPDLRDPDDRGSDCLDQIAGRDLVLLDLGPAVPRGAGLWSAGLHDSLGHPALAV